MSYRLHRVAVLNRSTVLSDDEVEAITAVLQHQVTNHFALFWGIGAHLNFVPSGDTQEGWKGAWNLVVLDTSDEANALGYHDYTPEGLPLGKAFAKTDQLYNASPSVTMSHELLEMLGDPDINLCAESGDGTLYAYENCDAVEADELGYEIDGVQLSDFVTPSWFAFNAPDTERFSYRENVHKPFELASGGYISVKYPDEGWTQIFARGEAPADGSTRPPIGSRRERRATPLLYRLRSVS